MLKKILYKFKLIAYLLKNNTEIIIVANIYTFYWQRLELNLYKMWTVWYHIAIQVTSLTAVGMSKYNFALSRYKKIEGGGREGERRRNLGNVFNFRNLLYCSVFCHSLSCSHSHVLFHGVSNKTLYQSLNLTKRVAAFFKSCLLF